MSETLLDNDNIEGTQSVPPSKKFKSRVPSDLMIVLGVLHIVAGLSAVFYYFYLLYADFRVSADYLVIRAAYNSLIFFFGLVFTIGGFGLVRHRLFGWIFSLAASTFGIMLPAFLLLISLFIPGLTWSVSTIFGWLFLLFFGVSFTFLISKTIRKFYQPTVKSYVRSGIILLVLSLVFLALPFLTVL
ncbi:MAG: hypothetical protein HWE22_07085 [Flavobacteriales bacterium]|nr:hypothetical protein [Flavobacteriales bacterium]